MQQLIIFVVIFVVVYLFYLFFVINKPRALAKLPSGRELSYLKYQYHLDYKKINMKQIANTIGLANAFIMSVIVTIISMIDGYLLAFLVGVALLVPLILIIYHLIGKYYQNKQKGKI